MPDVTSRVAGLYGMIAVPSRLKRPAPAKLTSNPATTEPAPTNVAQRRLKPEPWQMHHAITRDPERKSCDINQWWREKDSSAVDSFFHGNLHRSICAMARSSASTPPIKERHRSRSQAYEARRSKRHSFPGSRLTRNEIRLWTRPEHR